MSSIEGKSSLPTKKTPPQFSIKTLLVLTTLIAFAIANPGFAIIVPFAVAMLLLVSILIVAVGTVQFIIADDRKVVFAYVWNNLVCVLGAIVGLIAYLIYAYVTIGNLSPMD